MLKIDLIEINNDNYINLFYICLLGVKGNIPTIVSGSIDDVFAVASKMKTNSLVSEGDETFVYTEMQNAELTNEDVWVLCDPNGLKDVTDMSVLQQKGFMKVMRNPTFAKTKYSGVIWIGTLEECMNELYVYLKRIEKVIYGTND